MLVPENICQVAALGVDMIELVFDRNSPYYIESVSSHAGTIPDRVKLDTFRSLDVEGLQRVGVFADEMPQTVLTQVYNYKLDYVQLNSDESVVYIDNLRSTLVPDIAPDIKIIKSISVNTKDDLEKAHVMEDHVDMLLLNCQGSFDFTQLGECEVRLPFIIGGDLQPTDIIQIKELNIPYLYGIDLRDGFNSSEGIKDIERIKEVIRLVK